MVVNELNFWSVAYSRFWESWFIPSRFDSWKFIKIQTKRSNRNNREFNKIIKCQKMKIRFKIDKIRDSENGKFHDSRNLIWLILTWTWSNFIFLIPPWLSLSQCDSRDIITRVILDYIIFLTEIFKNCLSKMSGFVEICR